jgi:hypothetical protein
MYKNYNSLTLKNIKRKKTIGAKNETDGKPKLVG